MYSICKSIKKVLATLLILSAVMSLFPIYALAKDDVERDAMGGADRGDECIIEPYFEYNYDTTCGYRYDVKLIPVAFTVAGLMIDQAYVLTVESDDLTLLKDYGGSKCELGDGYNISMDIGFDSDAQVDGIDSIVVSHIQLMVSSSMYHTIPCTLTLFIINSVDGVFVSYIDEEAVVDYYYEWLFDNGRISKEQLDEYRNNKTMTRPYIEFEDEFDSYPTRSIMEPKVYINYTITPLNSGAQIRVSGTLKWSDTNGTQHNLRNVKVMIMDRDTLTDETLATVYTSNAGSFTSTVDNQTGLLENGGCDVFLKIYPASTNIAVKTTSNGDYYFSTPVNENVSGSTISDSQVGGPNNTSKAFYIHQAGVVGALHVKAMSGNAPSNVVFRYPYSDSGNNEYTGSYIKIKTSSYYSWDVILHEYGHFIQDIYNIENNPGGTHYISENAIDTYFDAGNSLPTAKNKGTRLAWAEGWATYFSISAQVQQNVSSMNIPGSGDGKYNNLAGNWYVDLESYDDGKGEGHEMAVSCVLWDFADSSSTTGSTGESFDNIALGFQTVWNYTISSGAKIFDTFFDYTLVHVSTSNVRKLGSILGAYKFSAANPKTNGSSSTSYTITSSSAPTLSWTRANGSTHCADSYKLFVVTSSGSIIYQAQISGTSSSHTLPNATWQTLKNNYSSGFYWFVTATPESTPTTGAYPSQYIFCTINT